MVHWIEGPGFGSAIAGGVGRGANGSWSTLRFWLTLLAGRLGLGRFRELPSRLRLPSFKARVAQKQQHRPRRPKLKMQAQSLSSLASTSSSHNSPPPQPCPPHSPPPSSPTVPNPSYSSSSPVPPSRSLSVRPASPATQTTTTPTKTLRGVAGSTSGRVWGRRGRRASF